jgi:two-component system, cell cycle sensor histidine kinase and response regulator CckA
VNETESGTGKRSSTRARAVTQNDGGSALTALMRYNVAAREFRLVAGTGFPPNVLEAASRDMVFALGEERGLIGLVGARRQSIYVTNALSEPRWIAYLPILRSGYFTPVLAGDELQGVFALFSEAVDAFSTHERALADMYASELARVWRVAGLVDTLEEHLSHRCKCAEDQHSPRCSVVAGLKRLTQIDSRIPGMVPDRTPSAVGLAEISTRELEVIGALRRGLRSSQIARSLGISTHTARNHLKRVFRKLGVHSQVELLSLLESAASPVASSSSSGECLRVLHVEDDPRDAELMRVALEQHQPPGNVTLAKDLAQARAALTAPVPPYDVILTLVSLPDGSGLELVSDMHARALPVPVVVLTGSASSDQAVSALKAGADDYLVKADDYLARVPAALQAALLRFRAEAAQAAQPLRVLYAEDNVADADLAARHLQRHAAHVQLEIVRSGEEVLQRLPRTASGSAAYDVVLLDYRLPGTDAFDLLKALRDERKLDLAVVVITGYSDGHVAAQAFRFGATEYLVKHPGHLFALPAVLQGACHRVALARERLALRKQEQALRQSEARFRVLFEHIGVGVAELEMASGRTVRANQKYCEVFGYRDHELIGSEFVSLLHPEDSALHHTNMQGLKSGDLREFTADRRGVRKDGSEVWVNLTVSPLPAGDEHHEHCVAVVKDITDRTLQQNAQRLLSTGVGHLTGQAFFDEVALRIAQLFGAEVGFVGKLVTTSPPRLRMLALSVDGQAAAGLEYELSDTPCERVIHQQPGVFPCDVARLFPTAQALRTLGVTGYVGVPLLDSTRRALGVLGVMSRAPLERPDRIEVLSRLFAVRAAAELERQRTDAQFHDLFEFLPDAVIIVNTAGAITLVNRQAETLFGYTRQELVGMPVELLVPTAGREQHEALRRRSLSSEEPRPMGLGRRRLRAQRKDGSVLPVDICLSPMRSDDGTLVVAAVRDISERERVEQERERLEAQLRQAQKMDAVGTLASGIAHDFNNLLAVIVGNADAIRLQLAPEDPAQQDLDSLQLATNRAGELLHRLLTFSRDTPTTLRTLRIGPVVLEAVKMLQGALPTAVELSTALVAAGSAIHADSTQIHQVIFNLLTNAWHALEGRPGRIEVAVEDLRFGEPSLREQVWIPAGDYVHVYVRDTGSGMDAATRERAFEPFFTTKPVGQGTGLGLSVVHGIMKNHGGLITLVSEPAKGTTFHLYFPTLRGGSATR